MRESEILKYNETILYMAPLTRQMIHDNVIYSTVD